jgi:hypothetical protein
MPRLPHLPQHPHPQQQHLMPNHTTITTMARIIIMHTHLRGR